MFDEKGLGAALRLIVPKALQGAFSRCVAFHHLLSIPQVQRIARAPQPLWGMGSKRFGGRFTPRDSFETIYLAEDPVTALAEVTHILRNIPGSSLTLQSQPWVVVTVRGILSRVLDLTDASAVSQIGSNHQELTGEWRYTQEQLGEAPTQLLGRVCYHTGLFDGIRYPSSKNLPDGACLAVFPDRLKAPAFLEVYDPNGNLAQRLP
jgi:RES domain-containing protein